MLGRTDSRLRLLVLLVVFAVASLALVSRLAFWQVVERDWLRARAWLKGAMTAAGAGGKATAGPPWSGGVRRWPGGAASDSARSTSCTSSATRWRTSSRAPGKSSQIAAIVSTPARRNSSAAGSGDWWNEVSTIA